jgi:hypothetical protein
MTRTTANKKAARSLNRRWCAAATVAYVVLWAGGMIGSHLLALGAVYSWLAVYGLSGLFLIGLGWAVWGVEQTSQRYQARRMREALAAPASDALTAARRRPMLVRTARRTWNPLDQDAWYYGRSNRKLNQSLAVLIVYSLVFVLVLLIIDQLWGVRKDSYEMPGGGGQAKALPQTVKVQKIKRNKYVVNPYSAIRFETPPIDDVKLQLNEVTAHTYAVGYGEGAGGPGFGAGTSRGKVRLIRLQYTGGDWDQKFGIGADQNMLIEYGKRTGQKVAEKTESRMVGELRGFPAGKSPPVVYLTGEKNIVLSKYEVKVLRDYLLTKHGMIFGDNGGSAHFHNQFLAMMTAVLPEVRPVKVPLDDVIHRVPYQLPFLPYVAPHGGKDALGWWIDGRWVCYYHPGDIGDAWCDAHAGVKSEIWEFCYQLGTNVLFYAHVEYAKWLESQQKSR